MLLTEEEQAALEQFRRHRRENPAGLSSDAWLRTPDAVTLADAMLRLFPVDDVVSNTCTAGSGTY